ELRDAAELLARDLVTRGVGYGDMVTIALPNSVDWFVAQHAIWRVGGIPQPVSARLPQRELEAIVELADSRVVFGVDADVLPGRTCLPIGYRPPAGLDGVELPDIDDMALASPAWKAPTSGGSTGRPKLIVSGDPAVRDTDAESMLRVRDDECMVVPGPLYHNGPAVWATEGLMYGNHVVLLPRFDAEATLAAIDTYRADVIYLVPTMMKRIWRLPEDVRERYDVSSLRVVWHLAEPCPPWLKKVWIDWLGPERIFELYAGTEAQTVTIITGEEWLAHRGSVGKVPDDSVMITDADGVELPPGEMGEVWLRNTSGKDTYRYVGAEARTLGGGWESLGDMGYVDQDGYLYLGDRSADMILSGGANIYPAEVEAAINEHPAVRSACVIGLPDDDLGNRVHAIIEADPTAIDDDELRAFLGNRLARYKVPRSFEVVDEPLRDDAGKMRRSALRAARVTPAH
ncbi:MAG: AMP-binding protein, partial [Ilumatobacteraceae bacterium]